MTAADYEAAGLYDPRRAERRTIVWPSSTGWCRRARRSSRSSLPTASSASPRWPPTSSVGPARASPRARWRVGTACRWTRYWRSAWRPGCHRVMPTMPIYTEDDAATFDGVRHRVEPLRCRGGAALRARRGIVARPRRGGGGDDVPGERRRAAARIGRHGPRAREGEPACHRDTGPGPAMLQVLFTGHMELAIHRLRDAARGGRSIPPAGGRLRRPGRLHDARASHVARELAR